MLAPPVEACKPAEDSGCTKRAVLFVLLDLTMPNKDGKEAFYEMREVDPDVPIIMTSGYSKQVTANGLPGAERTGFVQKPYSFDDLPGILSRFY